LRWGAHGEVPIDDPLCLSWLSSRTPERYLKSLKISAYASLKKH
jgi:hypothetical protein